MKRKKTGNQTGAIIGAVSVVIACVLIAQWANNFTSASLAQTLQGTVPASVARDPSQSAASGLVSDDNTNETSEQAAIPVPVEDVDCSELPDWQLIRLEECTPRPATGTVTTPTPTGNPIGQTDTNWFEQWLKRIFTGNKKESSSREDGRGNWNTKYYEAKKLDDPSYRQGGFSKTTLEDELRYANYYGKKITPTGNGGFTVGDREPQIPPRKPWTCQVFKINCPPDPETANRQEDIYYLLCRDHEFVDTKARVLKLCQEAIGVRPAKEYADKIERILVIQTDNDGYDSELIPPYIVRWGASVQGPIVAGYRFQPGRGFGGSYELDARPECREEIYHWQGIKQHPIEGCGGFVPYRPVKNTTPYQPDVIELREFYLAEERRTGVSYDRTVCVGDEPYEWIIYQGFPVVKHFTDCPK